MWNIDVPIYLGLMLLKNPIKRGHGEPRSKEREMVSMA